MGSIRQRRKPLHTSHYTRRTFQPETVPDPDEVEFQPEAVTKDVLLHTVELQRHAKGRLVFCNSQSPRKIRLSLPRVRWLERPDV